MFDWQLLVALVIVAAAAAYVFKRLIQQLTGVENTGCGGCPNGKSCSSGNRQTPAVVQLSVPQTTATRGTSTTQKASC